MSTMRFVGRKWLFASFFIMGFAVILAGIYIAGLIFLPSAIKTSYQERDCDQALQLFSTYSRFYIDARGEWAGVSNLVIECAIYNLAVYREEQKAWQDAYNADKTYLESYPSGVFYNEVHIQIARVLLAWAKDLYSQKDYRASLGKLEQVAQHYTDTAADRETGELEAEIYGGWSGDLLASKDYVGALDVLNEYLLWSQINRREEDVKAAKDSFAPLYLDWGAELRKSEDFAGAERTFHRLQDWARANQQPDVIKVANYELAETYLEWGLSLQSQRMFSEAKSRLEQALTVDPEAQSDIGPAVQAKSALPSVYISWGDMLVAQNDFSGGLAQYKVALELSDDKNQAIAKDAILHGYLMWADALVKDEDFIQALEKIKLAEADPGTDAAKKDVETARAQTYQVFSNSTGKQAQQAMKDAVKTVCQERKKPALAIFGLNVSSIRASVFGVDAELPENIAATTPGEMHYVACVEQVAEVVAFQEFSCCFIALQRINWQVILRWASSALEKEKTVIQGGPPPPFLSPEVTQQLIVTKSRVQFFAGSLPVIADLANWLLTILK